MKPAPHRPSDPFLGVTVLEDYRVVAHVRAEPRGDTYRALPLHTGHPVLVKLIAQGLPRDFVVALHIARGHVPTEVEPIQAIAKALSAKPHEVLDAIVQSSHDAADGIRAELAS